MKSGFIAKDVVIKRQIVILGYCVQFWSLMLKNISFKRAKLHRKATRVIKEKESLSYKRKLNLELFFIHALR